MALLGGEWNVLVLTFYHAVVDGLSGVIVLRDLLLGISGQEPAIERPWGEIVEDWLGEDFNKALAIAQYAELSTSLPTWNA